MVDLNDPDFLAGLQAALQDNLPNWVIYRPTTADHPGKWLCRLHLSLPQPKSTSILLIGDSLDEIRGHLPPGLTCIGRMEGDDPVIEEVWL